MGKRRRHLGAFVWAADRMRHAMGDAPILRLAAPGMWWSIATDELSPQSDLDRRVADYRLGPIGERASLGYFPVKK